MQHTSDLDQLVDPFDDAIEHLIHLERGTNHRAAHTAEALVNPGALHAAVGKLLELLPGRLTARQESETEIESTGVDVPVGGVVDVAVGLR